MTANDSLSMGAAIYAPLVLRIYDQLVYGFASPHAWRCPEQEFVDLYNRHVSANHLDVGPGTGRLLDRCRFPGAAPRLALLDINPNSLKWSARRIARYQPTTYTGDVLRPLPVQDRFDSIGLNLVLHCIPGDLRAKAVAFDNLKPALNPGGVLFGSTIPCHGVQHNVLGRMFLTVYNRSGIFSNRSDRLSDLSDELNKRFRQVKVWTVGTVALFVARDVVP